MPSFAFRMIAALWGVSAFGDYGHAQTIRVVVVEAVTSEPIAGAIVSLVDADSRATRPVLTDQGGRAALGTNGIGPYRIRVERVGFSSVLAPVGSPRNPDEPFRIELTAQRNRLRTVAVKGRRQCGGSVAEGASTLTLWDEVRKALTATVLTQREQLPPLPVLRFTRMLDRSLRVEAETTQTRLSTTPTPFRTESPDDLARIGFVREVGGMLFDFYGPDAALLLSEPFVRDHCFSAVQGRNKDAGLIGLAFDPVTARKLPDISGVLWLDRDSGELRELRYRYVNLTNDILSERSDGHMEFQRLPNGRWIVARWRIRTPRLAIVPERQVGRFSLDRHYELIGYKDEGGVIDVAVLANAAGVPSLRPRLSEVSGAVYDSLRGEPIAGARVYLEGTSTIDTTDSLGRYRLATSLDGSYTVAFEHPRLTRVGFAPLKRPVQVTSGARSTVDAAVPSLLTLRSRCPPPRRSDARDPGIVLMGVIRQDAAGAPQPGASALITWSRDSISRTGKLAIVRHTADTIEVQTDSIGAFLTCGIPHETEITVRALPAGKPLRRTYERRTLWSEVDLALGGSADDRGSVHGKVLSLANGAPLKGAEVVSTSSPDTVRTGPDGAFVLRNVPRGTHHLQVRGLGYVPTARAFVFDGRDTSTVTILLAPIVSELPSMDITRTRDAPGHDESTSGATIITREMLTARRGSRLSDLLRTHARGVLLLQRAGGGHAAASSRSAAGADSRRAGPCYMKIVLDGIKIFAPSQVGANNPPPDLDQYSLEELDRVEVYIGPAQTPPEFTGAEATCGTLVLSMKR